MFSNITLRKIILKVKCCIGEIFFVRSMHFINTRCVLLSYCRLLVQNVQGNTHRMCNRSDDRGHSVFYNL